jgi:shikimate dehydrogenase
MLPVPFKKTIIPFLDELSAEAKSTQSVNTLYLKDKKVIGHNTDIIGFETSIKKSKFNIFNKEVLILGAGGVVSSIIYALKKMKVSKIKVSNRTKEKAENLKKLFKNIEIIEWGEIPDLDVIINATSIGLKKDDYINLDFSLISKNNLFYDVIYNPRETNFLKTGKSLGNTILNGKLMFIYQALSAFNIWHGIEPRVNENVIKLLD